MNLKAILRRKAFWKSVFWLGLSFVVIYNIITMLFEYGGFHFSEFISDRVEKGSWLRFIIAQILGGFIYGFILAFGQFHLNQKKK